MSTVHVPRAQVVANFDRLIEQVRAGAEIWIEEDAMPPIRLSMAKEDEPRRLSESLRLAREFGSSTILDGGFEADLLDAIAAHQEPLKSAWD